MAKKSDEPGATSSQADASLPLHLDPSLNSPDTHRHSDAHFTPSSFIRASFAASPKYSAETNEHGFDSPYHHDSSHASSPYPSPSSLSFTSSPSSPLRPSDPLSSRSSSPPRGFDFRPLAAPLPRAPPRVMRIFNGTLNEVLDVCMHKVAAQPELRTKYLIHAMAWMINMASYWSGEYQRVLKDHAESAPPATTHRAREVLAASSNSTQTLAADPSLPSSAEEAESDVIELDTSLDYRDHSRRRSVPAISPQVSMFKSQYLLFFLSTLMTESDNALDPLPVVHAQKLVSLPEIKLPPTASSAERRVVAFFNVWREMRPVRSAVQNFFSRHAPFEMATYLHGERLRCSELPFGIMLYPLYPRSFSLYPMWANTRFAAMLGYEHMELLQMINSRWSLFCLYHPEDVDIIHNTGTVCISSGRRNATYSMRYLRKDKSVCPTFVTSQLRYFDSMVMYQVLYIQESPEQRSAPCFASASAT